MVSRGVNCIQNRIEHPDEKKLPPGLIRLIKGIIPFRAEADVKMELEHSAQRIKTATDDLNALLAQSALGANVVD